MFQDALVALQAEFAVGTGTLLALAREISQAESGYEHLRTIDILSQREREELLETIRSRESTCP
jgi:hypothetical protein